LYSGQETSAIAGPRLLTGLYKSQEHQRLGIPSFYAISGGGFPPWGWPVVPARAPRHLAAGRCFSAATVKYPG
jgi:hypothetical protein